jgi:monovalent cation:H+ antiporter, CPA1 family
MLISQVESAMEGATIETNLKQFLLVLSVSLSVATLPKIVTWFRKIPYTLLLVIVGLGLAIKKSNLYRVLYEHSNQI